MPAVPAIYASLRSADLSRLDAELAALEVAGVDGLHLDVMDGSFGAGLSLPLEQVRELRARTRLPLDLHLMVADPLSVLDAWIGLRVQRISLHLETCPDPTVALQRIRAADLIAGLVILPGTATSALDPWLDQVGVVNPLGVDPLVGGGFVEATYDRIAALARRRAALRLDFRIQADGGVWAGTRDGLLRSGADELVGGYPIFSKNDYVEAVRELREGA